MLSIILPQTRQLTVEKIKIQLIMHYLIDTLTQVSPKCINICTNQFSANAYLTGGQILHIE